MAMYTRAPLFVSLTFALPGCETEGGLTNIAGHGHGHRGADRGAGSASPDGSVQSDAATEVDANVSDGQPRVYVSPTGADGDPCTEALPCRTFNRAYQVAAPGQVVGVMDGAF